MSERSIQHYARAYNNIRDARATAQEALVERIEAEIERIRETRPHLSSRLDRAAALLVAQLSLPAQTRPVRVRVGSDGRRLRFLVRSLTSGGVVYSVDPATYSCSCPDAHRQGKGCKHSLACFILKRAARGGRREGCALCIDGWVYIGEDVIDSETGEVTTFHNPIRCRRCSGVQPPYLTDEELQDWMASVRWIYAKSMPRHPHEYCLKREQDEELFERVVRTIWDQGYDRTYLRRPWRSLEVGDHFIWVHTEPKPRMPAPLEDTVLVNRAERVQERIL